jgi:cerevisin
LTLAPLIAAHHLYGTIKNSYIVMLKPDVSSSVLQNHLKFLTAAHESDLLQLDGDVKSGIHHVFDGYTGMFTDGIVDKIREMPEVDYVKGLDCTDYSCRHLTICTLGESPCDVIMCNPHNKSIN